MDRIMKLVTIVGARPQFIKAAVISRAISQYNSLPLGKPIREIIIHTGQHYDSNMSDIFFEEMNISKPHYHLGVGGGSQGAMTGRMLEKIEAVLIEEKPDIVLVYGDTNSTLAGALSAVKLQIPVAHVEAGIRSFNMRMPEEINRILTDRVSHWLFCPSDAAVQNLCKEGSNEQVYNVGDVMYDSALYYKKIACPSEETLQICKQAGTTFYLATVHRAENTDDLNRLSNIVRALDDIAAKVPVILPLHPRTCKILKTNGIGFSNVKVVNPIGYFDMITLLSKCSGVFTDSGGVQKEAYFFGKPCITLRDETEWVELVSHGFNRLVGADYERIIYAERNMGLVNLNWNLELYGDGNAGERIINILVGKEV